MKKLSKEDLRATFQRNRIKHTDWPADFDAAMARPIVRAMIYALARQHEAEQAKRPALDRKHQAPQRPTVASIIAKRREIDRKSLAAGEKPEPDDAS